MENDPLPWLAAPTTAGTGAEMTRNAVLDSPAHRVKRSLRDARLVARAALLDPELTRDAPRNVTAAAGLDAITQLFESALSRKARPETTAAALAALPWARAALPRVLRDPADMPARAAMLMAAGVSGLCLAHSGLGLAHALAAPLGGRRGVAHGVACGALLPHVLRHNRAAAGPALDAACAAWLGASPGPTATERALEELAALVADGDLPLDWRAADWTAGELDALARDAVGSSLAGNPRPMSAGDVREFLRGLIGV